MNCEFVPRALHCISSLAMIARTICPSLTSSPAQPYLVLSAESLPLFNASGKAIPTTKMITKNATPITTTELCQAKNERNEPGIAAAAAAAASRSTYSAVSKVPTSRISSDVHQYSAREQHEGDSGRRVTGPIGRTPSSRNREGNEGHRERHPATLARRQVRGR
jgi:hypothetical protein